MWTNMSIMSFIQTNPKQNPHDQEWITSISRWLIKLEAVAVQYWSEPYAIQKGLSNLDAYSHLQKSWPIKLLPLSKSNKSSLNISGRNVPQNKKNKNKKNSHGQHSNNILFSMPKVELTIERKTFTTNSRCRYRLVVTRFMTRNSKNWHAFTMKIPRHLKCSLALIQHAWKQQNTAKGEHILMLNENTHTPGESERNDCSLSLTRSSRMETGKSNMHIFTGWARALCRLNRDLGSILPDGESAGCCPGACFILGECCSPCLLSHWYTTPSLPLSLSLSPSPFQEWVHRRTLFLTQKLLASLCVFLFSSYTQHKQELATAVTNTQLSSTSLASGDGKKSEWLDLLPALPFAHCLAV